MKIIACITAFVILLLPFTLFAYADNTTAPEAIANLTELIGYVPQVQNKNIQSFLSYSTSNDISISNYNFSNGMKGVRVSGYNQNNPYVYFTTGLFNIKSGQTYTINYTYCFGLYNTGTVEIYVSPYINDGHIDEYSLVDFVNESSNSGLSGSYSFSIDRVDNVSSGSSATCELVIKINKTSSTRDFYFALDIDGIYGVERNIASALYKIGMNSEDILAVVSDLQPFLEQWRMQQGQNLINIGQREAWIYQLLQNEYSDFEDEYGDNFTKLVYDAICEALGIGQEPETFPTETQFSNAVDDYSNAESAVMPNGDSAGQEIDSVLSDAGADSVLQNNGAYEFIRNTLNSVIFENTKITAYVVFALGMGLVVLVLGRKIHA